MTQRLSVTSKQYAKQLTKNKAAYRLNNGIHEIGIMCENGYILLGTGKTPAEAWRNSVKFLDKAHVNLEG